MRSMAQLRTIQWMYNQKGLVATVQTAEPHATAWQRFLPTGPLALLPVRHGFSNIVWSTSPERAAELETCGPDAFVAAVNEVLSQSSHIIMADEVIVCIKKRVGRGLHGLADVLFSGQALSLSQTGRIWLDLINSHNLIISASSRSLMPAGCLEGVMQCAPAQTWESGVFYCRHVPDSACNRTLSEYMLLSTLPFVRPDLGQTDPEGWPLHELSAEILELSSILTYGQAWRLVGGFASHVR